MPLDARSVDTFIHRIVADWRMAGLSSSVRLLCEYAEKVTLRPADCRREDVDGLRAAGWCDTAIHDAVQIVSYFNYINRVADALGVEMETDAKVWGQIPESR